MLNVTTDEVIELVREALDPRNKGAAKGGPRA